MCLPPFWQVEPGDHRPCTNRDTTHNLLPKRSRTSTPTPTVRDHPSTGTQAVLNEVREVDGAQPATEPFNFSHVPSSSAPAESCAISGTECNNPAVTRSTMQSTCALDRGESASNSGARQHLTTGRAWSLHGGQTVGCGSETATDSKARIESYANWKSRALTLMESKVKAASSENDIGRQPPPGGEPFKVFTHKFPCYIRRLANYEIPYPWCIHQTREDMYTHHAPDAKVSM